MTKRVAWFLLAVAALWFGTSALHAQVAPTGTLSGSVVDPSGAAVVGANVQVTDTATGKSYETKSGSDGRFVVANLAPGIYNVTVTIQGFRKGVFSGVKIIIGQTYDLSAKLELGEMTSSVVVEAGQEVIETNSATVGTTITGKAITQLPFTSRDVSDLAVLEPGAQTAGRPRNTSFMGLPKGAINMTFDGINVQDNVLKSNDGFFTIIRPRVDDVAEFSISTAAAGAEQAGEGAVQIRFVSARGGNAFHGGVWWYHRNDFFNSNYYFNNLNGIRRQVMRLNEYGYKIGGPILKDRLFFFTDFDFYSLPQSLQRSRTILTSQAVQGQFTYPVSSVPSSTPSWVTCNASNSTCTANLMAMAASFGATSTVDSVVGSLLSAMQSAASAPGVTLGAAPSLFQQSINFNNPGTGKRKFPDLRLDWNISKNHSFEFDYHYAHFTATPDFLNGFDQSFPVAPFNKNQGSQISNRSLFVGAWRWNIGASKSNELRVGLQSAPVAFFPDLNLGVYPSAQTNLGAIHVRPLLNLVSQPLLGFSTQGRNAALGQLIETFGWTRGAHNMAFGVTWTEAYYNDFFADEAVATVRLGLDPSDPITPQFSTTNLPGISPADLTSAQQLYAMLAGRVASSGATPAFNASLYFDPTSRQFKPGQNEIDKLRQRELGFYGTDNWRLRPSLTLNYGLRWEYQGVPRDTINEFFNLQGGAAALYGVSGPGNLFKPGTLSGSSPAFVLNGSNDWYNKYYRAFAPSVGLAWQPGFESNAWKKLFGGPGKTVFRAGYSISYTREGINNFFGIMENNPGYFGSQTSSSAAAAGTGQFAAGSLQLQSLSFQNVAQSPTSFQTSFAISPVAGQQVNVFDANLKPPLVQSWSVGIQRELTPNMVLEVRYVGNHGVGLWRRANFNEVNIFENGFLSEFKNALNNLNICKADATCKSSPSFGNLGLAGQVPLPILTAAFTGSPTGPQTNGNFKSGTFITNLTNGLAGSFASSLSGSLPFLCNLVGSSGFPAGTCSASAPVTGSQPKNFWAVNPDARGGSFILYNGSQSTYNGLQVEFRRRPSKGLQFNANYTWSRSLTDYYGNSSINGANFTTLRNVGIDKGLAPFDVRHAIKVQGIYELPFGPGRKWSSSHAFVNRLIEGWEFNSITRWQTGRVTELTGGLGGTVDQFDGGVILNGLTVNQLQSQLGVIKTSTPAPGAVFYFPGALLDSKQQKANSQFLAACNTAGAFCPHVFVYGPQFFRADWSAEKRTNITERVNFEIRAELLNAFNNANFFFAGNPAAVATTQSLQSTTFGRILDAYADFSTTDDPGGRIIQLVFRINF